MPTGPGSHDPVMRTRGILYWKWEDGPPGAEVGAAWIIEADGAERSINGGDRISLAEAERLAAAGDYTLDAEELRGTPEASR